MNNASGTTKMSTTLGSAPSRKPVLEQRNCAAAHGDEPQDADEIQAEPRHKPARTFEQEHGHGDDRNEQPGRTADGRAGEAGHDRKAQGSEEIRARTCDATAAPRLQGEHRTVDSERARNEPQHR